MFIKFFSDVLKSYREPVAHSSEIPDCILGDGEFDIYIAKGSVTYRFCPRETSYGRWGVGGLAPVTFLGEKSWKISIV